MPEGWDEEMERRCELATPQDTARGLFFTSILEAVRALGDEAALARCQQVLGGQNFVGFFNYPIEQLVRLSGVATRELSGRYGGPDKAARALGRKAMVDFLASAVGNAVRVVAGKDIRLFLGSVQTIYRMAASYGERTVTWNGPRSGRLLIRRSFLPVEYHEGVLEELFTLYGVKDVKVRGQRESPLDGAYDFSWE
ncbi:TIGR02265 family protein [Archangium lansingense]|uniref:TIGR02265 family protein n=1 Tax=Archangium lansingense TaxID=2995310 RepID=A0ABT3ZYV6_9BACT|nr:TIGR02265 family protein [Archangium lansinium]MCY1074595.1 TIGR02265 family protein [Archangium lansinium]